MTLHSVYQILSSTSTGVEAGTGWFCKEANDYARQKYPEISRDAVYGVTNAHVVRGSQALYARFSVCRKSDLPLQLVGICQESDLAIVKLSGVAKQFLERKLKEKAGIDAIPTLQLMNSDACMPAQYDQADPNNAVLAYGYPLGCEYQAVTRGVVEGWKRIPGHSESLFIAHTATIQPGNSGGCLVLKGKVVGVNSLKATSQQVDNLNMSISSNVLLSYLPHLVDERQSQLSTAVVRLANRLNAQGLELSLLEASCKEASYIGDPATMETAYNDAMHGDVTHDVVPDKHKSLSRFVKYYAARPGFHSLWSKVTYLIHTGNHAQLRNLAASNDFESLLCRHCKKSQKCRDVNCSHSTCQNMYAACQSAMPAKVVHSVSMGFEYKPVTAMTAAALGLKKAVPGGVVVSKALKYGPTAALQRYDVITAVKTSNDGMCKLDENGEHFKQTWGLSLSLGDIVERAPLGTEVAFQVHRGDKDMVLRWEKTQQNKPSCRALDTSEQHLNSCITLAGCSFKVLRMNDMADPRIAQSEAAKYAMDPQKRHLEKIIVANVDPSSVAYHNWSLQPGMVLDEINRTALADCASPWVAFCQMLVDASKSGVALIATEGGGVDSLPVTKQDGALITQYIQQII